MVIILPCLESHGSSVEFRRQMEALNPTSFHSLYVHGGRGCWVLRGGVGEEEEGREGREERAPKDDGNGEVVEMGGRKAEGERRRRDAGAAVGQRRGRGRIGKPEFDGGGVATADINGGKV